LVDSIKKKYPKIRVNVVTNHAEVLENNKNISLISQRASFFYFRHWYLEIRQSKNPHKHILSESLKKLGLSPKIENPRYCITKEERKNADKLLIEFKTKPLIAINTVSKESTKNWLPNYWREVIAQLSLNYRVIQLGDKNEKFFEDTFFLAGKLNLRESIAVLEKCDLFIGGVSFLMHAAAAVGIRSVIIYGGRETPKNSGYKNNINLYEKMDCGPCWIHEGDGEKCENNKVCMKNISVERVVNSISSILKNAA
jgi:ADP-heptose:LPS heptosyltransferase